MPIYKEVSKIKQIFKFIKMLEYPKEKLDVCILIEKDDLEIQQFLNNQDLPFYVNVILIPFFQPKTKPKALNYGINFIKGKYVVIYDAEDIPDAAQLQKAVKLFDKLSKKYLCIQCRLNFYNTSENIITECMSVEYSTLFDFYLFGLEYLNLPILLGGTSNHFRVKELKKIGLWDSYNVTEDAELSIRIYSNKYKIAMLDSITLEEAPISINVFIKQRSRWIKGFLQTFFCYTSNLEYKKFNLKQIIFIIVNLLFFSLSLFIGPILILSSFFVDIKLLTINLIIFISYHLLISLITSKEKLFNYKYFFASHAYYFLHMFAFVLSIYDLIKKPFHWRKTDHGISKIKFK
ncbi:MAG: glycosyltransferase family 2 protein [Rickettsiales bacterium]